MHDLHRDPSRILGDETIWVRYQVARIGAIFTTIAQSTG